MSKTLARIDVIQVCIRALKTVGETAALEAYEHEEIDDRQLVESTATILWPRNGEIYELR